jgi:hypothetical protein
MINHWTIFEGMQNGRRRQRVRVTLNKHRTMVLNQVAYKGIGEPKAVELMFDANRNMIGLRRCDPAKKNAFHIRPSKQGRHVSIALGAFLTHFEIKPTRTVLFEDPSLDASGLLTLDLTKTTAVSRGAS